MKTGRLQGLKSPQTVLWALKKMSKFKRKETSAKELDVLKELLLIEKVRLKYPLNLRSRTMF